MREALAKLFGKIADPRRVDSAFTRLRLRLRRKRFKLFLALVKKSGTVRVLDIGGTVRFWENMGAAEDPAFNIALFNLKGFETNRSSIKEVIIGDCRDLSRFSGGQYDVVFSNSVIEHLREYGEQKNLAKEIQRIGKSYFVQTPNFYFPLEPHFLFPCFQYMPISLRAFLVRHFKLGYMERVEDFKKSLETAGSIRLLKKRELARLFPKATIYEEKFCGLTKSFVAYGRHKD